MQVLQKEAERRTIDLILISKKTRTGCGQTYSSQRDQLAQSLNTVRTVQTGVSTTLTDQEQSESDSQLMVLRDSWREGAVRSRYPGFVERHRWACGLEACIDLIIAELPSWV